MGWAWKLVKDIIGTAVGRDASYTGGAAEEEAADDPEKGPPPDDIGHWEADGGYDYGEWGDGEDRYYAGLAPDEPLHPDEWRRSGWDEP